MYNPHMEFKPEITFEDFEKLDIRAATVLEASLIEGSDKLIKLVFSEGMLLSIGSDNNSKPNLILLEDKVENGEGVN